MADGTGASGRAAPQIRYALSRLPSRNGHHEFEHLCRELARLRITPNILPATGPVSAGGDQGRDFETFRTCIQERLPGTFLAAERDIRIVFACTLQRENLATKIKNDLRAITDSGQADRVYFFCEQDIPVAARHELCKRAHENYGVDLEIIDGQALSELLAAEDCMWIAERYLGIEPSPRQPGTLCSSAVFGEIAGIGVGAIHGNVTVYQAEPGAAAPSGAGHRQRRRPAPPDRSPKRSRRVTAGLVAVAAAAAPVLIFAPWDPSVTPSPHSPAGVLDDVAARQWSGTVFYDRTLLSGHEFSIPVTLSVDPSPSTRAGDTIGFVVYGEGCPRESVTVIRNDPRVLTLADAPPTWPITPSCQGNPRSAVFFSALKLTISITLTGGGQRAGISVLAATRSTGTIYRGTLYASN